jgi:cytochrome c biogenesis protein CcmG/thiol:disulfide interchange protein DsbE
MAARAKQTLQLLAVGLVAGLLGLLIWKELHGSGKTAEPQNFTLPLLARPADFAAPRVNKPGTLELASLRGKVVVLNFWASWCIPCKQEAPALERVWRDYRSKGVVVLGVDSEDFTGDARSFMREHGITYPVVREQGRDLYGPYGVSGVPETRVIDRRGKYAGTQFYGATTVSDLRRSVQTALRS